MSELGTTFGGVRGAEPLISDVVPTSGVASDDAERDGVAVELLGLDPTGERVAQVIRDTYDQLLDGQRTGRWDYGQLKKTEKTHMGTLVEINLHREFDFDDGLKMDYRIAGYEVDCKFSRSPRGWQIPLEAEGHLCLLVWADDLTSLWSAGLVRISPEVLRIGGNRDRKRTLNDLGVHRIRWLWKDQLLPENLLLHLDEAIRSRVFSFNGKRDGQRRTDELFRLVHRRLVSRAAVLTVAQQDDPPKRVRDARIHLRPEGIVILGHQGDHPRIARALNLPVPRKGQWVGARIAAAAPDSPASVPIGNASYRLAQGTEPGMAAPEVSSLAEEPH